MTDFFTLLFGFFGDLIDALDSAVFEFFGANVSLAAVIFALLALGLIISIFWKGAQT